jgi:hypothetical protein
VTRPHTQNAHKRKGRETNKAQFLETPQVNEIQSFVVREQSDGTDNDFLISSVSTQRVTHNVHERKGGASSAVRRHGNAEAA